MKYELTHIDEFDRFEGGQMASQEAETFRQRLLTDHALAEEHALYMDLCRGIRSFHRQRLKAVFNKMDAENSARQATQREMPAPSNGAIKWAIAATISILLGAGVLMWQFRKQPDIWQLAFIEEPGLPVLMSKESDLTRQYNEAMNYYRQGQFEKASASLPLNNSDTVKYYRGIFALKMNNAAEAEKNLQQVRQLRQSEFRQKADYYTGMALWKAGKNAEAKKIFTEIKANPDHVFFDQASNILHENNF